MTRGRSVQGMMWLCIWLTLPKEARILPTFRRRSAGRDVKVMNPSSTPTSVGANTRKKSARAYGSTIACSDSSLSCISSDGVANCESFLPMAPRKSPMTAMSGLKTFDEAAPPP